jgi:hypothetical protein
MHFRNGSPDVSNSAHSHSFLLDPPYATASPRGSDASSVARAAPSTGVDRPRLERAVREILLAIGEDPDRDGLHETPARAAKAWIDLSARRARGLRDAQPRLAMRTRSPPHSPARTRARLARELTAP